MAAGGELWEVVGGGDKGGILVRAGAELTSAAAEDRLATGALVRGLERQGERLRYERLTGSGPTSGWVSIKLNSKDLLVKRTKVPPSAGPRRCFYKSFDGEQMSYLDYAPEDRASFVVIYMHGVGSEGGLAAELVGHLWAAGFRLISPDLRGHGQSAKPLHLRGWENDAEARDIAALASHLELASYACVAYSHGAIEALRLVSLDVRVRCLVIGGMGHHCTHPKWDRPTQWPCNDERDAVKADISALGDLLQGNLSNVAATEARPKRAWSTGKRTMAWVQRGQACIHPEELAAIRVPVKIVHGDKDTENGITQNLSAMIPGCELEFVPGNHQSTGSSAKFWERTAQFLASKPPMPLEGAAEAPRHGRDSPLGPSEKPLQVSRYYGPRLPDTDAQLRNQLQDLLRQLSGRAKGLSVDLPASGTASFEQLAAAMARVDAALLA